MLCKLSLKRLLYVLFLFSILICLHVLITVINNGTNYNNIRHRFNAADITEKPITSKFVKKNGSKVVTQITEKIIVPEKPITTTTEEVYNKDNQLPWYFKNGSKGPKINEEEYNKIWPWQAAGDDRITNQLMHIPKDYDKNVTPLKTILLWAGLDPWVKAGRLVDNCPVNRCSLTDDHAQAPNVDAIIFRDRLAIPSSYDRPPKQVWIINLLECPFHTDRFQYNDLINWTATYRRDSDIVTPYERWVYYDENVKQKPTLERNFAANKTRLVAWFVSNCNAKNDRQKYAHELQKHISVDIYGFCGTLKCPRTQECFRRLDTTYKFYLAFENSNCVEYITEKFFLNGLQHDILPIVMGARPEDYAAVAPYHSYIHVDDFASPKELAQYLHKLDKDDDLYNSYFGWKGTGEFINTHFLCRVCTMLHSDYPTKSYPNLNKWWKNVTTCTNSRPWHKERKPSLSYKLPS